MYNDDIKKIIRKNQYDVCIKTLYNFLKNNYKDFDSEEEKRAILKQLRY